MSTPTRILALVGSLSGRSDVADTPAALRFNAEFSNAASLAEWQSLLAAPDDYVERVAITVYGSDVPLDPADPFVPGRRYGFGLVKRQTEGETRLFFQAAVTGGVVEASAGGRLRIADLLAGQSFETRGLSVGRWDASPQVLFAPTGVAIDARRLVFDYSEPRTLPADLRPWLLLAGPTAPGDAYRAWKADAAVRLLSALVDQTSGSATDRRFRLSGPPAIEVSAAAHTVGDAFRPLNMAAEWVFVEATDQETRHLLFGIELAHTLRASGPALGEAIPLALESAKAAYRAHLQSANRDTLKALADLRLAVIEETQKVVARTHDLTAALWRDLLVAAAPFVIKLLPDSAQVSSKLVEHLFQLIAAVYLVGSFVAQALVNRAYFSEEDRARAAWQNSVARYLPAGEVAGISSEPVRAAKRVYTRLHVAVGVFYAVLVVALLVAAAMT